jgi:hypothetical protein
LNLFAQGCGGRRIGQDLALSCQMLADLNLFAQGCGGRRIGQDLALSCQMLASGHAAHRRPSQGVEQLDRRVADHQAARRARGDCDFECERGCGCIGQRNVIELTEFTLARI